MQSSNEWTVLINLLGGTTTAGSRLKEINTFHWDSPNSDATNESGMTILAGGNRTSEGGFVGMGGMAGLGTTTISGLNSYRIYLSSGSGNVSNSNLSYRSGLSIRCLKD